MSDQPYIYEPSSQHRVAYPYSDFNPKAVSQATYRQLEEKRNSKPKQDGPLINFNQHPDSYMIVAGQNVNWKPMPANTKKQVIVVRWVQFSLRIIEEIAALGLLVCVICLKGMPTSLSWIYRIAVSIEAIPMRQREMLTIQSASMGYSHYTVRHLPSRPSSKSSHAR